jgi:hypothetical protein
MQQRDSPKEEIIQLLHSKLIYISTSLQSLQSCILVQYRCNMLFGNCPVGCGPYFCFLLEENDLRRLMLHRCVLCDLQRDRAGLDDFDQYIVSILARVAVQIFIELAVRIGAYRASCAVFENNGWTVARSLKRLVPAFHRINLAILCHRVTHSL